MLETFQVLAVTPIFASSYSMNDKVPKVKAAANVENKIVRKKRTVLD